MHRTSFLSQRLVAGPVQTRGLFAAMCRSDLSHRVFPPAFTCSSWFFPAKTKSALLQKWQTRLKNQRKERALLSDFPIIWPYYQINGPFSTTNIWEIWTKQHKHWVTSNDYLWLHAVFLAPNCLFKTRPPSEVLRGLKFSVTRESGANHSLA